MKHRGMVFDTQEIKQHFANKKPGSVGSADLGSDKKGKPFPTPAEWNDAALLWGVPPDPEDDKPVVYSHVGKPHRFHHSSMVDGGDVIGAGEWIVKKGNSGRSAPQRPLPAQDRLPLGRMAHVDRLRRRYHGVPDDSVDDKWVNYPIRLFISAPTANNRYWTHPRAMTM